MEKNKTYFLYIVLIIINMTNKNNHNLNIGTFNKFKQTSAV